MDAFSFPQKTRELHNHHFDSTVWNDFRFRDDDIVIATYAKAGTTWMQQIVGQLVFGGRDRLAVQELSPWLDLRIPPKDVKFAALEAQQHRRFIKTHLPLDALVFSPVAKYIYVGRDGRDVVWSLYNHHAAFTPEFYEMLNGAPGLVGPPLAPPGCEIVAYFRNWLEKDGYPFWPMWENVRSWWAARDLPNVLLVHYANLKRNLPGQMRRIARFLDIAIDHDRFPEIVGRCTFDYMKEHADEMMPHAKMAFVGGGAAFIHKGINGRWRDRLAPHDVAAYETRARQELGAECAHWLETGEMP